MGFVNAMAGMVGGKLVSGTSMLEKLLTDNLAMLVVEIGNDEKQDYSKLNETKNVLNLSTRVTKENILNSSEDAKLYFYTQFNPNELVLDSTMVDEIVATDLISGTNLEDRNLFPKNNLTVTLDFDETKSRECFQDGVLDFLNPMGLARGAIGLAASAINGMREHTVQYTVEALLAILKSRDCRMLTFVWNDFAFRGELSDVQATYTMFSNKGAPVRAKVLLRIQQNMNKNSCKLWAQQFDDAFNYAKNVLGRGTQNLGDMLNVNL